MTQLAPFFIEMEILLYTISSVCYIFRFILQIDSFSINNYYKFTKVGNQNFKQKVIKYVNIDKYKLRQSWKETFKELNLNIGTKILVLYFSNLIILN